MQVGCGSFPGAFDGRSYSYNQVMSWKSEREPLKRMINPKAVFDAMVTGASSKGTWARVFRPPVEGRVVRGEERLDVGDRVRVKLLSTDVARGFIDFGRV